MFAEIRNWRWWTPAMAIVLLCTVVWAEDRDKRAAKPGEYDPDAKTVELFAAIEKGDIDVKLIPKDSKQSKVLIENKTDQPLNIKLPDSFSGVPVLAQGVGGAAGGRSNSGNKKNQSVGGGMGGMGGGGGMGGMGGGMFNVAPEQVGKFDVTTVCLDHGKAEPRPAAHYEIKPLETSTTKPGMRELCELLGKRQVGQRAAQAAAWHLNNDMTWEQLAAKWYRSATGTPTKPYFTAEEIQAAQQIASTALGLAEQRKKSDATHSGKSEGTSGGLKSAGDK